MSEKVWAVLRHGVEEGVVQGGDAAGKGKDEAVRVRLANGSVKDLHPLDVAQDRARAMDRHAWLYGATGARVGASEEGF